MFVPKPGDTRWRIAFVVGLWLGALAYAGIRGGLFEFDLQATLPVTIAAGLIVGFGTRLSNGCTSGHGVSGIARFSKRSTVATLGFMAAGIATVFVTRHLV